MKISEEAVVQLQQVLHELMTRVSNVIRDLNPTANTAVAQAVDAAVSETVCQLEDSASAPETARRLLNLLWEHTEPPMSFWETPLGLEVAERGGVFEGVSWSGKQAAEWLGVATSTVYPLKSKGIIEAAADGKLSAQSVIEYGKQRRWRRSEPS